MADEYWGIVTLTNGQREAGLVSEIVFLDAPAVEVVVPMTSKLEEHRTIILAKEIRCVQWFSEENVRKMVEALQE